MRTTTHTRQGLDTADYQRPEIGGEALEVLGTIRGGTRVRTTHDAGASWCPGKNPAPRSKSGTAAAV